ncbi:dihydropteroate synthase [Candidatus Acetothermia bacterium]|nr:dihydropteroate synthase [Candidatus Acetothermia bacterium]MCI2427438.1 dihydropteroate synthase [Candidatus Acetothermia bacterium]
MGQRIRSSRSILYAESRPFCRDQQLTTRGNKYRLTPLIRMSYTISNVKGLRSKINDKALVMGILNVTPDSFYDGGRYYDRQAAIDRGLNMIAEGADIIDIGGMSTRPGAAPISLAEELARVIPVIEGLREKTTAILSIDTYRAAVARRGLDSGVSIVNDISALRFDAEMASVVAEYNCNLILMHMQGRPQTMQNNPVYQDVVAEIISFLEERIRAATAMGIDREQIIIDPGIGFGKRDIHNFEIIRRLNEFRILDCPILIGLSRKSFIGRRLNLTEEERLEGTIAANAIAIANGADIIRVHDIQAGRRTADLAVKLRMVDPPKHDRR